MYMLSKIRKQVSKLITFISLIGEANFVNLSTIPIKENLCNH